MSTTISALTELERSREERAKKKMARRAALLGFLIPWGRTKRLSALADEAQKAGHFTEAARLYRKLAMAGGAEAQFQLGMLYYKGRGVVLNLPEAVAWMHRAADQGHAAAQFFLGQVYRSNIDARAKSFDPSRWYPKTEEAVNTGANGDLLFPAGVAVPCDKEKSNYWLRKAADQSYPLAMVMLAKSLLEEERGESDAAEAVEYLKKAVASGNHPVAEFELGRIYIRGLGVERNAEAAVRHFKAASEGGMTEAAFQLGLVLAVEPPPIQNFEEAARWFNRAADQGHVTAQLNLGNLYWQGRGVPQDLYKAARWFRKAAAANNPIAQLNLGLFFERGQGVEKDVHEAAIWYLRAAKQGNAAAQYNIANLHVLGRGVTRNMLEAVTWFLRAALLGHVEARINLALICAQGRLGKVDFAQGLMWLRLAQSVAASEKQKTNVERTQVDMVARMSAEEIASGEQLAQNWVPDFDRALAALHALHAGSTP